MVCATHLVGVLLLTSLFEHVSCSQDPVSIYFGCGCFWHVQHEFVKAEESILKRSGGDITAISGYAGQTAAGTPCYYDGKDHTEVVGMDIPLSSVKAFADVFWGLFVGKNRVDTMDVGLSYRAAIGVPGGMSSSLMTEIRASMDEVTQVKFVLEEGSGDDRDTLGEALVWVYDTAKFPFHQAEIYHQFHDDFLPGGNYPDAYEALRTDLVCGGRLSNLGCSGDSAYSVKCKSGAIMGKVDSTLPAVKQSPVGPAHGGGSGGGALISAPVAESSNTDAPAAMSGTTSSLYCCAPLMLLISSVMFSHWRGLA